MKGAIIGHPPESAGPGAWRIALSWRAPDLSSPPRNGTHDARGPRSPCPRDTEPHRSSLPPVVAWSTIYCTKRVPCRPPSDLGSARTPPSPPGLAHFQIRTSIKILSGRSIRMGHPRTLHRGRCIFTEPSSELLISSVLSRCSWKLIFVLHVRGHVIRGHALLSPSPALIMPCIEWFQLSLR